MFDTLVESTSGKKSHRSGKFATWITLFYLVALTVAAVWSIMQFNASLAETADASTLLAPPPPPPPPPPPAEVVVVQTTKEVVTSFTPPKDPPKEIPKAVDVKPKPVQAAPVVSQGVPGGTGVPGGVPGGVPAGTGDSDPRHRHRHRHQNPNRHQPRLLDPQRKGFRAVCCKVMRCAKCNRLIPRLLKPHALQARCR